MIKSKAYELLLLASLCEPNALDLRKQMLLAKITQSDEYADLSNRGAFREVYWTSFTMTALRTQEIPALERAVQAIKLLPRVLTELLYSLQNGCGPRLSSLDKPDFYNAEQLSILLNKLESDSFGRNLTNIEPNELLRVFDDYVVRSAGWLFYQMPADADCCSTEAINEAFPNIKYCVSRDDMLRLQESAKEIAAKSQDSIKKLKSTKSSRILIKIALIMLFTITPVMMQTLGMLTPESFSFAEVAVAIISFLYLFLG